MYGHGAVSSSSGAKRPIASAPAVAASAVRHHASHVRSAAIEVRCQTSTAGGSGSGAAMRRVYAGSARWARTEAASSCVKAGNGPTAASTSSVSARRLVVRDGAHRGADGFYELERAVEELARGGALHDVVVRGQQQRGVEFAEAADRRLVGGRVVVARRDQAVARAVVDAVGEHRVDHDRRAGLRVPQAEMPERMAGQREHLELAAGSEAHRLASLQPGVDRRVAAQLVLEERDVLRGRPEPVGLVPAVVAGQHRSVGLDRRPVGLAAQEARARRQLAHRDVAAAVVDVGVGDEHVVDPAAVEVGRDHGARHLAQAGVDQQRPLLAHQQVLADVALAEVTLDPVDAAATSMLEDATLADARRSMSC